MNPLRRIALVGGFVGLVSASGFSKASWLTSRRPPPQTVDAARYDAFWIWAGVRPQPVLAQARTIYLLQGQIEAALQDPDNVRMIAQGTALPAFAESKDTSIWLVYRAHTLRWTPRIDSIILAQLARWRASSRNVVGVQIDFDARTYHLDDYFDFLKALRARLPEHYRLSITGLLDWSSRIDVEQVNQLRSIVDEVVVQTYQGRATIPNYAAYLSRVARLRLPFKIGLMQGGTWVAPPELDASTWFRGYVVFLRNKAV